MIRVWLTIAGVAALLALWAFEREQYADARLAEWKRAQNEITDTVNVGIDSVNKGAAQHSKALEKRIAELQSALKRAQGAPDSALIVDQRFLEGLEQ